jgi:hypothetical protein
MLERILVGNIISMSKGLGYTVPGQIEANIFDLRDIHTKLKGTHMLGFLGTFPSTSKFLTFVVSANPCRGGWDGEES